MAAAGATAYPAYPATAGAAATPTAWLRAYPAWAGAATAATAGAAA